MKSSSLLILVLVGCAAKPALPPAPTAKPRNQSQVSSAAIVAASVALMRTRSGPVLPDTLANKRVSEVPPPPATAPPADEEKFEPEPEPAPIPPPPPPPPPPIELKPDPVPPAVDKPAAKKKAPRYSATVYTSKNTGFICPNCAPLRQKWGNGNELVALTWDDDPVPDNTQWYPAIRWKDSKGVVWHPARRNPMSGELEYYVPDSLEELAQCIRSREHG